MHNDQRSRPQTLPAFLAASRHGYFVGETAETARPGLEFSDTGNASDNFHLLWDDFFAVLDVPSGVRLAGRAPVNSGAIVLATSA